MQIDEFIRRHEAAPFEIINGKEYILPIEVMGHVEVRNGLWDVLYPYCKDNNFGDCHIKLACVVTYDDNIDTVRSAYTPDVLVVRANRIADYKAQNLNWRSLPLMIMPDLVAEVISPTDLWSAVHEKVDAYLADGVRLIWLVDPQRQKVTIYAPDQENPIALKGDAVLDGGDIISGFQIPLSKLFA